MLVALLADLEFDSKSSFGSVVSAMKEAGKEEGTEQVGRQTQQVVRKRPLPKAP